MQLFSSDFRGAKKAEAEGDYANAALLYSRSGSASKAAELYLRLANMRSEDDEKLQALRDAELANERNDKENKAALASQISHRIGEVLFAQISKQKIVTPEDKKKALECAEYLAEGGDYLHAGELAESCEKLELAADYYQRGGHIHRMEHVLGIKEHAQSVTAASERSYADYLFHYKLGQRTAAMEALQKGAVVGESGKARRILADLQSKQIGDVLVVSSSTGKRVICTCQDEVIIGRAPEVTVSFASSKLSRRHTAIKRDQSGIYWISDLGSRNGTTMQGMPISTPLRLPPEAEIILGGDIRLKSRQEGDVLVLTTAWAGRDYQLVLSPKHAVVPEATTHLPTTLLYEGSLPRLRVEQSIVFNGESMVTGDIEPIRGDAIRLALDEWVVQ